MKDRFVLGAHYYRPPFPGPDLWADDLARIRASGLNTVQLWLVWGWCEPEPGRFRFDDYDRLADLAAQQDLGLLLCVLPELNPFWIHEEVPDGRMVDIENRPVTSSNRWECLSALTPGACSDHPGIRRRMETFMEQSAAHFRTRPNLVAWDTWNENRWCNMAADFVCVCDHSLAAFRRFLEAKYGSLDGLGRAWGRRYQRWEHVRPGRPYGHSYPELHDFTAWIALRAAEMAQWRVAAVKRGDPDHPVGTHTGTPTVYGGQNLNEILFSRGIDWDVAAGDFYGYSSFPKHAAPYTGEDWNLRTVAITEPSIGKPVWISELQGGPVHLARNWGAPVPGAEQQAWVWSGLAQGAKGVVFWCWRPEVFGIESGGFGLTAGDGFAGDRLKALQKTASVLRRKTGVLRNFQPDAPEIALLFQRDGVFQGWMHRNFSKGSEVQTEPNHTVQNYLAYARALEKEHLPYLHLDDRHLPERFGALRLVIAPDPLALDDAAAAWLIRFADQGGTVLLEGAAGLLGSDTYRRDTEERPLTRLTDIRETVCRAPSRSSRTLAAGEAGNAGPIELFLDKLETGFDPDHPSVRRLEPDGFPMLADHPIGKGRLVILGSVVGRRTWQENPNALRNWVRGIADRAGVRSAVRLAADGPGFCCFRSGRSGTRRLLFLTGFNGAQNVTVTVDADLLPAGKPVEEWAGHPLQAAKGKGGTVIRLAMDEFDWAVLEWG